LSTNQLSDNSLSTLGDRNSREYVAVPVGEDRIGEQDHLEDKGPDLKNLWWTLYRRRAWALGASAITLTLIITHTLRQTPVYESQITLNLQNRSAVSLGKFSSADILEPFHNSHSTTIQILQSKKLVQEGIDQLPYPYRLIFEERKLNARRVLSKLNIRQVRKSDIISIKFEDPDPEIAQAFLNSLGQVYTGYSLENQRSRLNRAIKFAKQKLPEAQAELEESAQAMQQFRIDNNIYDPQPHALSLAEEIRKLESRIQDLKGVLVGTRQKDQALQQQLSNTTGTVITFSNALFEQDASYRSLIQEYNKIQIQYNLDLARFTVNSPQLEDLRSRRAEIGDLLNQKIEDVLGSEAKIPPDQLPPVFSSESGSGVKNLLLTDVLRNQVEIVRLEVELESLEDALAALKERFQALPELQKSYTELARQLKVNSGQVDFLLGNLQQLQITAAQEISSWQVLDPPHLPKRPISPKTKRIISLGLIVSTLVGVSAAILVDYLDERVSNPDELLRYMPSPIPILCQIPKVEAGFDVLRIMMPKLLEGHEVDISANRNTPAPTGRYHESVEKLVNSITKQGYHSASGAHTKNQSNSFRESIFKLALSLRYIGTEGSVKTIAITSSMPGEGKSTLAFSLAATLADLGARTLLVDCDLRRPMVARIMHLPNNQGLSNVLATNQPWKEIIHSYDKLHVLTSGPKPPNPLVLLDSEKMRDLLRDWRSAYDYVLLDATPSSGLADTMTLLPNVDLSIGLVGLGLARRPLTREFLKALQHHGNFGGIALNLVDKENGGYYYGYRYYSYYYNGYYSDSTEENLEQIV